MNTLPESELDLAAHRDSRGLGPRLFDQLQARLAGHGYVYVHGAPAGYDYCELLSGFGEFVPQYDGALVWDLTPEPDMDEVYHSKNTRSLVPHTEAYEFAGNPPRFLALWCVKQAGGPGGETTLADGYAFLERLPQAQLDALRRRVYRWHSSEGLATKGIHVEALHPALEANAGRTIMRFSYNNVDRTGDRVLNDYLERGKQYFDAEHRAIAIEADCLLLWDNWRMIHSRNAFTDRSRHLKRVLIR